MMGFIEFIGDRDAARLRRSKHSAAFWRHFVEKADAYAVKHSKLEKRALMRENARLKAKLEAIRRYMGVENYLEIDEGLRQKKTL